MLGGCMAGMGLLGLAVLIGVVVGLVYLMRGPGRGRQPSTAGQTAGEDRAPAVPRERYARGEIDQAEYERRADLDHGAWA